MLNIKLPVIITITSILIFTVVHYIYILFKDKFYSNAFDVRYSRIINFIKEIENIDLDKMRTLKDSLSILKINSKIDHSFLCFKEDISIILTVIFFEFYVIISAMITSNVWFLFSIVPPLFILIILKVSLPHFRETEFDNYCEIEQVLGKTAKIGKM